MRIGDNQATGQRASRPRVALIADVPNWAYAQIARQVQHHLADRFEIEILCHGQFEQAQRWSLLQRLLRAGHFDVVHFFWRDAIPSFLRALARTQRSTVSSIRKMLGFQMTTSVYDHLYATPEAITARRDLFGNWIDGYNVSSELLDKLYRALPLPPPLAVVEDGVDFELFQPQRLERLAEAGRPLMVGWAGNGTWAMGLDGRDRKGLHTLIKPAIACLQRQKVPVHGRFADRNEFWTPFTAMPDFFHSLDVYICASEAEGTATPVLEAMACGLPVISTPVGVVPQIVGPLQRRFLLTERSVAALTDKLQQLVNSPELRCQLSAENLLQIQTWTWKRTADKWNAFLNRVLARRTSPLQSSTFADEQRVIWATLKRQVEEDLAGPLAPTMAERLLQKTPLALATALLKARRWIRRRLNRAA